MSDSFSRDVLDQLLPEGAAWTPATADDYDLLLEGVADNSEAVRLDMDKLRHIRNPKLTPILSDLEKEFAVIPSATATESECRQRLAAWMFRRSGQPTYETLEEKLQEAGFNVHVWPNDPVVDPAIFLLQAFQMTCGDLLPSGNDAQCGEPEAFCAEVGGELLVNGEIFMQFPHYINLCGEALVQCGEPDAQCGLFNHILLIPITYTIPTNPGYWPAIFFVGGDRDVFPKFGRGVFGGGTALRVRSIIIQADDQILLAGGFLSCNGVSRNRITRIDPDGDLDLTFDPGTGADDLIYQMALQTDDKIMIVGFFSNYNGTARSRIARLDIDGSLDATFDPGTGANSAIYAIALQADDKSIIGGVFINYDGTGINRIARINTDGTLDGTFGVGTGVDAQINAIAIQPADGKSIIGGAFTVYNGNARHGVARINTDGTIDGTFTPGAGIFGSAVYAVAIQGDGKIILGGLFTKYDGTNRNNIVRINADGTIDLTFNPGAGANNAVNAISIQADGQIVISGAFDQYNFTPRVKIARLNIDGSLDASFNPGTGATSGTYVGPTIFSLAIQPDNHILAGGYYFFYNSVLRNHITRVLENGDNDPTFNYDFSIASATVPIERRLEFRRIILKYKPMFSWAGLIVVYN